MPTNLPPVNKLFRFKAILHKILLIIGLYPNVSKKAFLAKSVPFAEVLPKIPVLESL